MQPPSIRTTRGLRIALGTTLAGLIAGMMFAAPATAATPLPDPRVVYASDTYVKLQCRFTVTSANYALGTVRGRVTTKISWNGAAGFTNLAEVGVGCIVGSLDTFTDLVHVGRPIVAGRAAYKSEIVTVPLSTAGYYLCVQGEYRLKNGIPNVVSTTCVL